MTEDVNDDVNSKENVDKLPDLDKFYNDFNLKFEEYEHQIDLLKNELSWIKEVHNKSNDFFLLKLESNLDKQNQAQIKQESKYNAFKDALAVLNKDNHKLVEDLSELNKSVGMYEQLVKTKNSRINSLKSQLEDFERNISIKDDTIKNLNNVILSLREFISDKDDSIKILNKEIDSYKVSISQKDEKINLMDSNLNKFNDEIINLKKIIASKEKHNKELLNELNTSINSNAEKYENQISSLKNDLKEKDSEILKIMKDIDYSKDKHDSLLNENIELQELLSSKEGNLYDLNKKYDLLKSQLSILKLELKEKDDNLKSLMEEVDILKESIDEKDRTINSLRGGRGHDELL